MSCNDKARHGCMVHPPSRGTKQFFLVFLSGLVLQPPPWLIHILTCFHRTHAPVAIFQRWNYAEPSRKVMKAQRASKELVASLLYRINYFMSSWGGCLGGWKECGKMRNSTGWKETNWPVSKWSKRINQGWRFFSQGAWVAPSMDRRASLTK